MFLAPAFLAGLLAIGLPLWLHRVARANPTRHPFASLMLLEASETQRTAQRTLRYWALLALRIGLLIAMALAFAGPLVSPRAVPVINPNARLHAVVIDASLSMQYRDRWQRAMEQANRIIDAARPGDQLLLVEAAGRRIQVVRDIVNANQAGSLRAALGGIQPRSERLDYGLLMSTAKGWLGNARLPVELHLISDLQQSASPLRFADLEPPANTRLVFHDVSDEQSANTYLESTARTSDDTLTATVKTTSPAVEKHAAILLIDGKEAARRTFQVGPAIRVVGGSEGEGSPPPDLLSQAAAGGMSVAQTRVSLPLPKLTPNAHRIEVRLEPQDALPLDDRYYSVIEHADPRVLLLSRTKNSDDAVYAAAAIGSLSTPRLAVEQRSGQEIENRALAAYSVVVITDVAALSSAATSRLVDYIGAGGAALVTLGPGAAEQRNALLSDLRIGNVATKPTAVAHVDTSHPALRDASGWQEIRFFRHLQVTPDANDRVLIALQDGTPLLIERTVGAGRLLVLTAPLDRNWNDLATHPLFVRFMAQAARYLTGSDAASASARVGAVVMTGLTGSRGGQIFDPQGRRALDLSQTAAVDRLIPDQAGFYEIRSAEGVRWLAVNTDARESNLTRMSPDSLRRWEELRRIPPAATAPLASSTAVAPNRVTIGYWLLLLAAMLIAVETIVANHYLSVRREVPQ